MHAAYAAQRVYHCSGTAQQLCPFVLFQSVQRVIKEWFALVDDDGSGTLEHHELLAALQVGLGPH